MNKHLAEQIYQAVLSCPHEIESGQIILKHDSKTPGKNALAQLHDGVTRAAFGNPAKEKLDSFMRHIILYAKGWYKKDWMGNQLEDVKKICAYIADIDLEHYSDEDAYQWIYETFLEFASDHQKQEFFRRLFRPFGTFKNFHSNSTTDVKTVVESLLGAICNLEVKGDPRLENRLKPIDEEMKQKLFGTGTPEYKEVGS